MRLYGSVEEVMTVSLVYKVWWILCSYPLSPPHPTPEKKRKKSLIWILFSKFTY